MDYDDELRLSCEKTGDLLHRRSKHDDREDVQNEDVDEFEAEMEDELDNIILNAQSKWSSKDESSKPLPEKPSTSAPSTKDDVYDKDYFDSSDDEDEGKKPRTKLTNDELLYDPEADDDDAKWVEKTHKKAEGSDAVLNCPACLTVICIDCQRHEKYHTQYRAMFYLNCVVDAKNVLRYKQKMKKKRGRAKEGEKKGEKKGKKRRSRSRSKSLGRASDATDDDAEDLYHPVKCEVCETEVGVFDSDEIVHFFNVVASHK